MKLQLILTSGLVVSKRFIIVSKPGKEIKGTKIGKITFGFVEEKDMKTFKNTDPNVDFIEEDKVVKQSEDVYSIQKAPKNWGLDRIDQKCTGIDGNYFYNKTAGASVTNYILDTGIDVTHPDFEGRAVWGPNYADNNPPDVCLGPHGTHVAGIIGSKNYGVAKKTNLVSVKVLDCEGSGYTSDIIKGIQWVTAQAGNKKVINMSLGGGLSKSFNIAVEQAHSNGVSVVVAAGNEQSDACRVSPASAPSAFTVGSTARGDTMSSFSNYGSCIDIFAPGSAILSTVPGNKTSVYSGTSMASPHVAGVVSLALEGYPNTGAINITEIYKMLIGKATKNKITGNIGGSPNLIVYSV